MITSIASDLDRLLDFSDLLTKLICARLLPTDRAVERKCVSPVAAMRRAFCVSGGPADGDLTMKTRRSRVREGLCHISGRRLPDVTRPTSRGDQRRAQLRGESPSLYCPRCILRRLHVCRLLHGCCRGERSSSAAIANNSSTEPTATK